MVKHLLLCCLFLSSVAAFGKKGRTAYYDYYNNEVYWRRFVLEKPGHTPGLSLDDTTIIIATTRQFRPDSMRFLTERSDHDRLRYFVLYSDRGLWHLTPVGSLSDAIATLPETHAQRDWVVYTEGMGKIFTSDADRGMRMAGTYGVEVLLLDYPSIRTDIGSFKNYYYAKNNAIAAYQDFAPVFDSVRILRTRGKMGAAKLSLFFHSMGAKVIKEIVENNAVQPLQQGMWVDNIILNAPCVSMRGHRQWVDQLTFAKRVYIHYNPNDQTLKWARILSFHKQLGDRLRSPLSPRARYINFNTLCGGGHSNFLTLHGRQAPPLAAFNHYQQVLLGDSVKLENRAHYSPSVYRRLGWDVLPLADTDGHMDVSGKKTTLPAAQ